MFWGKKKEDDPKEKQIKSLKYAFPSIRKPNNDDTLFEIRFNVETQVCSLRVAIPNDFPISKPSKYWLNYFITSIYRSSNPTFHHSSRCRR
jgi:hypothetical protein